MTTQNVGSELARGARTSEAYCDHAHFFRSAADRSGWLKQHPGGRIVSVADGFASGRGFAEGIAR